MLMPSLLFRLPCIGKLGNVKNAQAGRGFLLARTRNKSARAGTFVLNARDFPQSQLLCCITIRNLLGAPQGSVLIATIRSVEST